LGSFFISVDLRVGSWCRAFMNRVLWRNGNSDAKCLS
jgi:hypothetical protein